MDLYPFALLLHIIGALGVFVALAFERPDLAGRQAGASEAS